MPVFEPKFRIVVLAAAIPFALFAAYVAWLIVPLVVTEVVPAVVRSVVGDQDSGPSRHSRKFGKKLPNFPIGGDSTAVNLLASPLQIEVALADARGFKLYSSPGFADVDRDCFHDSAGCSRSPTQPGGDSAL